VSFFSFSSLAVTFSRMIFGVCFPQIVYGEFGVVPEALKILVSQEFFHVIEVRSAPDQLRGAVLRKLCVVICSFNFAFPACSFIISLKVWY